MSVRALPRKLGCRGGFLEAVAGAPPPAKRCLQPTAAALAGAARRSTTRRPAERHIRRGANVRVQPRRTLAEWVFSTAMEGGPG
jgi:hypothetical protein